MARRFAGGLWECTAALRSACRAGTSGEVSTASSVGFLGPQRRSIRVLVEVQGARRTGVPGEEAEGGGESRPVDEARAAKAAIQQLGALERQLKPELRRRRYRSEPSEARAGYGDSLAFAAAKRKLWRLGQAVLRRDKRENGTIDRGMGADEPWKLDIGRLREVGALSKEEYDAELELKRQQRAARRTGKGADAAAPTAGP